MLDREPEGERDPKTLARDGSQSTVAVRAPRTVGGAKEPERQREAFVRFQESWRGAVGNHLVSSGDYETSGATRDMLPGVPDPDEQAVVLDMFRAQREEDRRFALALHAEQLARERRLGVVARSKESFQIVAIRRSSATFFFAGRDFEVPASPEASLRYYKTMLERSALARDTRPEALSELRTWEIERRRLLGQIASIVTEAAPRHVVVDSTQEVCYVVLGNRLVFVDGGELDAEFLLAEREYCGEEEIVMRELEAILER